MKLQSLSEQVRSSYKECSTVPLETRFVLIRIRAESLVVEIVVVTNVKSGPGIRIPAEQKLPARVSVERVIVRAKPNVREARELVSRAEREYVRVERSPFVVVPR